MSNVLVAFNDSPTGVVLASVLHTLGAIGFLGGLVGYLAWHRQLMHGHPHRKVLEGANFLAYFAIVVNLLGGFMRTFESDHPALEQFGESPWVRAILIKHLFLFTAMGAAVYLFERVAPRLAAAQREGTLEKASQTGHVVAALLVGLGIVVAAVLGALTLVVPELSATPEAEHDHAMETVARYQNETGQLTSTPTSPGASRGGFTVTERTASLHADFSWTPATFALSADLHGPEGRLITLSSATGQAQADIVAPAAGAWTYTVRADLAAGATWTLALAFADIPTEATLSNATVSVAPGHFAELNLDVEEGTMVHWAWSASATVHFDPHSHFDGTEQELGPKDTDADQGHLMADRQGTYSLLWQNTGSSPVTVSYRAWGDFAVLAE